MTRSHPSPAPEAPPPADRAPAHNAPDDVDIPPWRLWTAPAAIVLGFGLGIVGTTLVAGVAAASGSSFSHPTPAVSIVGDVVFDLAFVAAALYGASTSGGRPRARSFGFRRVSVGTAAKAVGLAALAYYGLTAAYAAVFQLHGSDKLPSELGVEHSTAALVGAAIFVCAIAPIAEEFFFRGFLFGALRNWHVRIAGRDIGTWIAALITAILFGLAHLGSASLEYLVPLGFLGFVLCLVRWRTRSLYPCMALHSANNALALGVNELSWNAAEIIGLILAAWLVVGVLTAPLARGRRCPA